MQEKRIEFETAKLAFEKGFNSSVYGAHIHREQEKFYTQCKRKVEYDFVLDFDDKEKYINNIKYFYPRCDQALLQKWLREVHDIHLNLSYYRHYDEEEALYDITIDYVLNGKEDYLEHRINPSVSYEIVLEQGLQEALKLIKNGTN